MELTIKVENKNVYDSLVLFFKSIGITIIGQTTRLSNKKYSEKQNNSFSPSPVYGRLKGKIITSPDFNEPSDDFKDYM